jgi:hypothetical protein
VALSQVWSQDLFSVEKEEEKEEEMQEMLNMLSDFSRVVAQIESYFRHLNMRPKRTSQATWVLRNIGTAKGGSNVDIIVRVISEMQGTLVVESYTNVLPDPTARGYSTANMLALCRDLLEFNGSDTSGDAYFAIRELPVGPHSRLPAIAVELRRPIRGLDPEEFLRCISHVAILADENDERLTREFNAKKIRVSM